VRERGGEGEKKSCECNEKRRRARKRIWMSGRDKEKENIREKY
jgi:hypothetical protein